MQLTTDIIIQCFPSIYIYQASKLKQIKAGTSMLGCPQDMVELDFPPIVMNHAVVMVTLVHHNLS